MLFEPDVEAAILLIDLIKGECCGTKITNRLRKMLGAGFYSCFDFSAVSNNLWAALLRAVVSQVDILLIF